MAQQQEGGSNPDEDKFESLGAAEGSVRYRNSIDAEGRPTGGYANGLGMGIRWQNGPLAENRRGKKIANGAILEDVIEVCIRRLQFFQDETEFYCDENDAAIASLIDANCYLRKRRENRRERGVEGKYEK